MKHPPAIRQLLLGHPDGLTTAQIVEVTGGNLRHTHRTLKAMPDAYIDRWTKIQGGRGWAAVWCVVVPPDDCPRPDPKPKSTRPRGRPRRDVGVTEPAPASIRKRASAAGTVVPRAGIKPPTP